jgi:hypothetical protein
MLTPITIVVPALPGAPPACLSTGGPPPDLVISTHLPDHD